MIIKSHKLKMVMVNLKISFHIIRGNFFGHQSNTTKQKIRDSIKLVNSIWNVYNISFCISEITESCALLTPVNPNPVPDFEQNLKNLSRNIEYSFNRSYLEDKRAHINIYIVPFIGSSIEGYAQHHPRGWRDYIVIQQNDNLLHWASTISHEIGHVLGLQHYERQYNLMRPRAPNSMYNWYSELTDWQHQQAYERAIFLVKQLDHHLKNNIPFGIEKENASYYIIN